MPIGGGAGILPVLVRIMGTVDVGSLDDIEEDVVAAVAVDEGGLNGT